MSASIARCAHNGRASSCCAISLLAVSDPARVAPAILKFVARLNWKSTASYVALLAAAFIVAVVGSWMFGAQLDNYAYDYMFRLYQPQPWQPQSVLLAIDEQTLSSVPGGIHAIRQPLAEALRLIAPASPKAVAVDVILAERSQDPAVDAALAQAFHATPNLV